MIRAALHAWREIWFFSLPVNEQGEAPRPVQVMRWLPVAGFALGLVLWITALLINRLVQHDLAAAAVIALAMPALYLWLTGGRSVQTVFGLVHNMAQNMKVRSPGQWPLLAVQFFLLLQASAILVLTLTGQLWWLVLMPTLGAAAYAELLSAQEEVEPPPDNAGPVHWYIAGGLAILIAGLLGQLVAGLFVVVLAWLAAPAISRFLDSRGASDFQTRTRAVFYITEVLILWIGVLAA